VVDWVGEVKAMSEVKAKATRVRAANRLIAVKVTKLKEPGLYEDGAGLRLVLTEQGVKRWALRLTINGRRVERGLGVWPTVSLDDARRKAGSSAALPMMVRMPVLRRRNSAGRRA
jgi:Arm DNA-binding domain